MNLLVRVLGILLAIACVVLAYYIVIWVLGMLGLQVPEKVLTISFVVLGLMAAIAVLSGKVDSWWRPGP